MDNMLILRTLKVSNGSLRRYFGKGGRTVGPHLTVTHRCGPPAPPCAASGSMRIRAVLIVGESG